MITKLANFSEISKALSVKNELGEELISLFGRFGLGRILCKLSLEKQKDVSAVQLILALYLIRICGETIHSVYRKDFYDLLQTGKNCYYRMMTRSKMGNTKYMVHGRKHSAAELIALYEREYSHDCRKYHCRYVTLNGSLGNQSVRIFLIRYGRNERWNIMPTTDVTMSFVRAFELYQLRWNIEVINKETKEYLRFGSYQGRDFNGQIAEATLCYLTYTVMVLKKRFSDYETMGELFADMKEDLLALTLWRRILACLKRLLNVLAERIGMTAEELMNEIITDRDAAADYELMAQALERRAG